MSVHFDPAGMVWGEFGGLEPPQEAWREQFPYWRDYNAKFFEANGLAFDPADDNVEAWLMAPDRAPFAAMMEALLPRLAERVALDDTQAVLVAHWLPDLHLGTSVTNFIMHRLGLEGCFGLGISDRGLSAPFFAFDCLVRYLLATGRRGLLGVADQKHVMYRSDVMERLRPRNAACLLRVDVEAREGLAYAGYARRIDVAPEGFGAAIGSLADELGLDARRMLLIGPPEVIACAPPVGARVATRPELVCTAPFAALAEAGGVRCDTLLLCRDDDRLCALGFRGTAP